MKRWLKARGLITLSVIVVVAAGLTLKAQQVAQQPIDQTTVQLVAQLITKYHISQKPLDDAISRMLVKRFIKELDSGKLYFLQSDIDRFEQFRDQLDDLLKVGNYDFATMVYQTYLQRLEDRIALAHKLIDAPHDFTLEETIVTDGEQLPWASNLQELNERWRKRIKLDLLLLKLDDVEATEAAKRLHKRYDTIRRNARNLEQTEVLELYLSSLAHCFDPHSSYMSPNTLEDFNIQMRLSLEGIGAALRSEDGYTVVAQIVPGGAADKDGRLKVGDKIIAVAQDHADWVDIVEMKLTHVVRLIRGPGGTKVRLKVINGQGETYELVLTRQKIELKAQEVKGEIIPFDRWQPGTSGRLGVIHIPSFYRDFGGANQGLEDFKSTARDVHAVLERFKREGGVDAVVIDLRGNGGGALSEAIEVTGLFIDRGPVVLVKEQNGRVKSHDDTESGVMYDGPLVVLCNRLSASASEIFAGAIKDYGRGIVIGDTTTHGKGTVQNVMPVSNQLFRLLDAQKNRGALKLTIQQFYRINGDSTQNRGVPSDIVLPSLLDHMDLGESFLENAMAFDRIEPAKHTMYAMTSPELLSRLKQASQERVQADEKFQEIQRNIQRFRERKNRKWLSLNEEQQRREREVDKAAEDVVKEEEEKETNPGEGPMFPDTPYNREIVRITWDYLQALRQANMASVLRR